MAGPFDHLHIKGRTVGTSNELSFDVLDAAREGTAAKESKKSRSILVPKGPRQSQGSYTGVGRTSTLSAVPEVERRKRARRNRAMRLWAVAIVAVVALASVAGYAGYRLYQDRANFTGQYNDLIMRFTDIDKTMVRVDKLMRDPLNSVEADDRKAALAAFPDASSALDSMVDSARTLANDPSSPADTTALSAIEAACRARQSMLVAAESAFKLSEIVNKHVDVANKAWNNVLAGDSMAREATKKMNAASTDQAIGEARDLTEQALDSMTEGKGNLELLGRELGVTFSPEISYIDKRIESLKAGLQTADSLIAGDRNAAIAANNAYNASDQEAAKMAKSLPSSVSDQVKAKYSEETHRLHDEYAQARSLASNADSTLRAA